MTEATGSTPLLLLDDVMSELDALRRSTLLARWTMWGRPSSPPPTGTILRPNFGTGAVPQVSGAQVTPMGHGECIWLHFKHFPIYATFSRKLISGHEYSAA